MPPRSQLLQDRSLRSREALVVAAETLWVDRAVHDVKVSEICDAAQVAKGLFYFYFDGREALAADLFATDADRVADAAEAAIAARAPFDELLRTAVTTLGRRAQRRPRHVLAVAVPAWVGADPASHDVAADLHVPLAATFGAIIDAGRTRRRGPTTVRDSVDAQEAGSLLADAAALAVHDWATSERRQPSLARRLSARVDLIVRGLT